MRFKSFAAVCGVLAVMIGCGGGGGGALNEVVEEQHPNGAKRKVVTYQGRNNIVRTQFFNPEGGLMSDQHFKEGKPHGERILYFPDGTLSQQTGFQDSVRHGWDKSWYQGGQIKSEVEYSEGSPIGRHVTYFEDGKIASEVSFKNGQKDGEETIYYPNGNKKHVRTYSEGNMHGPEIEYFDNKNNSVKSEKMHVNNALHGPFKTYHPNGKVEHTGEYLTGRNHGTWEMFNANGRRMSRATYDNGTMTFGESFN